VTEFAHDDHDVMVIVGSGVGGSTLAFELTKAGRKVVMLEAGPLIRNDEFANDERQANAMLLWDEPRTTSGTWQLGQDFPGLPAHMVKAVGGTTLVWSGLTPRFKQHEFKARTSYGAVDGSSIADWPISMGDLSPYYPIAEDRMGSTHRNGRKALPANNNYKVFAFGAKAIGYVEYATGPYATNAEPYDGRPASIQDGFNFHGDKNLSKWTPLVSEIPRALATGLLDLRPQSRAVRIEQDSLGRATAVHYLDSRGALHRQAASMVAVAGNAIETPRLLLLSDSRVASHGIGNESGHVGRHYTRHATGNVIARFSREVNFHRGETMAGIIADESIYRPDRGFVGGYYLQTLALAPIALAQLLQPHGWGAAYARKLDAYAHTAGIWITGEDMSQSQNRVSLSSRLDKYGLPVAHVHYDDHPNDLAMVAHARKQATSLFNAAGSEDVTVTPPSPSGHNMGTTRMSDDPDEGVVDRWGYVHGVPNIVISDGSVFTTSAAANPSLTLMAFVLRQADRILGRV